MFCHTRILKIKRTQTSTVAGLEDGGLDTGSEPGHREACFLGAFLLRFCQCGNWHVARARVCELIGTACYTGAQTHHHSAKACAKACASQCCVLFRLSSTCDDKLTWLLRTDTMQFIGLAIPCCTFANCREGSIAQVSDLLFQGDIWYPDLEGGG
jgi:hypothetical protein